VDPLTAACGTDPGWACEAAFDVTHNRATAEAVDWLVGVPLKSVLILIGAWVFNRLVNRTIREFTASVVSRAGTSAVSGLLSAGDVSRAAARAGTIGVVLRSISSFVIYGLVFLMVLGEVGINLGPLIAGAGIAGVAIGFGAQSLVKDFFSGIFMLVEDQYGVGDVVDLGVASGTVEAVSLRATRLRASDGTVWHVPNGQIERVGNHSQLWSRAQLDVRVAYDADLNHASEALSEAAMSLWEDDAWRPELLEPPEVLGVESLSPDGADIRVQVKTRPASQFRVNRELRLRAKAALAKAGIPVTAVVQPTPAPPP
jgi:small conductance mechanosensitive channel